MNSKTLSNNQCSPPNLNLCRFLESAVDRQDNLEPEDEKEGGLQFQLVYPELLQGTSSHYLHINFYFAVVEYLIEYTNKGFF